MKAKITLPIYSFKGKEEAYTKYRPSWPTSFALASLEKLGIHYESKSDTWSGIGSRKTPVVVCIGPGTGADPRAFLELGCIVYGVEPNEEFRNILSNTLFREYPKEQFIVINGTAHQLNLPPKLNVDLIVCAQSLHTFRTESLHLTSSEELARTHWQEILPKDAKNRLAIWYYNLDASEESTTELHNTLSKTCTAYAESKTSFLNPPFFEPRDFQFYIHPDAMHISRAHLIDTVTLSKESLASWLKSFSFGPKESDPEYANTNSGLLNWFHRYSDDNQVIKLHFWGFIAQGSLRSTRFVPTMEKSINIDSPLSVKERIKHKPEFNDKFWQEEPSVHPTTSILRRSKSYPSFFNKEPTLVEDVIETTLTLR